MTSAQAHQAFQNCVGSKLPHVVVVAARHVSSSALGDFGPTTEVARERTAGAPFTQLGWPGKRQAVHASTTPPPRPHGPRWFLLVVPLVVVEPRRRCSSLPEAESLIGSSGAASQPSLQFDKDICYTINY